MLFKRGVMMQQKNVDSINFGSHGFRKLIATGSAFLLCAGALSLAPSIAMADEPSGSTENTMPQTMESGCAQPTFTAKWTDDGVHVQLNNAKFVPNNDGSVSITSMSGKPLDSLPAEYEGHGIAYRMISDSELIAMPIMTYDANGYVNCIAHHALGGGITGAIGGAVAGGGIPGASVGAVGGIVGGLVWGPIDCWGK